MRALITLIDALAAAADEVAVAEITLDVLQRDFAVAAAFYLETSEQALVARDHVDARLPPPDMGGTEARILSMSGPYNAKIAWVPFYYDGKCHGVLQFPWPPDREPDAEALALLTAVGRTVALYLRRLREARPPSATDRTVPEDTSDFDARWHHGYDRVTGLPTCQRFHPTLEAEIERARRYGSGLGLLLIDVDDLTAYNRRFGAAAGDGLLARLGLLLRRTLRKIDTPFRYGGEEFVVILPHCSAQALGTLAERVRSGFAEEAAIVSDGPSSPTLSIGAVSYRHGVPMEAFIRGADKALDHAKRHGKNRVEIDSGYARAS